MANRAALRFKLDDLRQTVKVYGARVVRDALQGMRETVDRTVARTVAAAPKDSGTLARSIDGVVTTDGYTIRGRVRVRVPYASYVEFGTEEVDKQPHLVPSAIDERREMQARMTQSIVTATPAALGRPHIVGKDPGLPAIDLEDV